MKISILNKDCCFIIWKFVGHNAIFLNKELIKLLNIKKKYFLKNPITLYYKLAKFKKIQNHAKYFSRIKSPRPSIVVDKNIYSIQINGNIPFGKLKFFNRILPSTEITRLLTPQPKKIKLSENRYFRYRYKIYYWEIFSLFCKEEDIDKVNTYQLLFPAKNFEQINILNVF